MKRKHAPGNTIIELGRKGRSRGERGLDRIVFAFQYSSRGLTTIKFIDFFTSTELPVNTSDIVINFVLFFSFLNVHKSLPKQDSTSPLRHGRENEFDSDHVKSTQRSD